MGLIESSPHYLEILQLMLDNVSSRNIEKYLYEQYNERISYGTINNFRNNNLDIAELIQQVELQQTTIKDGKVNIFNEKVEKNEKAEELIIKEINSGIDVLNLIREGLSIANDKQLFEEFFYSEDVTLKDKMQVLIQLSKLDLDWRKKNDTNINLNNQLLDLSSTFGESVDW